MSNKNVTQGIPRLKELINTVKNIKSPSMTMRLAGEKTTEAARAVSRAIVELPLRDVVDTSSVLFQPVDMEDGADIKWTSVAYALAGVLRKEQLRDATDWVLRMGLKRQVLHDMDVRVDEVRKSIQNALGPEVLCLASDDNDDDLALHIRVPRHESADAVTDQYFLRFMEANIMEGLLLRGTAGVRKAYVESQPLLQYDPETGAAVTSSEAYVETEGINLPGAFLQDGIDPYGVTCNDPSEILAALGVEAARAVFLKELRNVIQFDGGHVSYRHLSLLADVVTAKGQLMSITRHGINRTDAGPLMKCTFEETCDILYSAAADCETDHLSGVAESVMLGALAPMGTGVFDVLLDTGALRIAGNIKGPEESDSSQLPPL